MKRSIALLFAIASISVAQSFGTVSVDYDVFRGMPLYTFVYQQPILSNVFVSGVTSAWKNPASALCFPSDKFVALSTHKIYFIASSRVSVGVGIQFMYNLPDGWRTYPRTEAFVQNRLIPMPIVGAQLRLW